MKRRPWLGFLCGLLLMGGVGCVHTPSSGPAKDTGVLPEYGTISTEEALTVIQALEDDNRFVLLDIRTPAEVEAGHIPGAADLDFYSDTFRDDLAQLDRDRIYLIYCRTGNRTGQTYRIMEDLGFDAVYDMEDGITQWMALDYPICTGGLDVAHTCHGT